MTRTRRAAVLFVAAVSMTTLAGCGGPPDMAGIWEGDLEIPDVGNATLTLDLEQGDEGRLAGTVRVQEEGSSPEDVASTPVAQGSVNDDGSFQVLSSGEPAMNVEGRVTGDVMDAEFSIGGPALPYRAERITPEEAQRRAEAREKKRLRAEEKEQEERDERVSLYERYSVLADEVEFRAQDVYGRVDVIAGDEGDGPAAQLDEALGPEDPDATEGDLLDDACTLGGVSCEVAEFENLLENDREDFADEDEYHPDACDVTTDRAYYEDYDLAEEGGAEYRELRDSLAEASEGLAEDAEAANAAAQRMAEVEGDYEASGGTPVTPTWTADEVGALAEDARAAEAEAEAAISDAEERYSMYEERVEEVIREALALLDAEGC